MKFSDIHLNERNPRYIDNARLDLLLHNMLDVWSFLQINTLGIDKSSGKNVIKFGNQRMKNLMRLHSEDEDALKILKKYPKVIKTKEYQQIKSGVLPRSFYKFTDHMTKEEIKKAIYLDNVSFGATDFDIALEDFSKSGLEFMGIDLPFSDDDDDITKIVEFGTGVNFIIRCQNIKERDALKGKLQIEANQIECKEFLKHVDI